MSISGNLKTMELSELLQWIAQGSKTGSLLIDNGKIRKRVFFVNGRIVASASTEPSEHLGHFLVSHGYITEDELAKAMEMQAKSKMLLGKILVTIGAINEDELRNLLVMKTEESVYDIFAWPEGEFRFVEDDKLDTGMVPMALDVTAMTLQGMNRVDEWRRIRKVVPSVDVVPVTLGELSTAGLPPGEAKIVSLVDDDRSIREICIHSHASEFQVSQVLFQQYMKRLVKFIRLRGPVAVPETVQTASASSAMPLVNAGALIESANKHLKEGTFGRALRHLRAALSLEPDNKEIEEHLRKAEHFISDQLRADGLDLDAVPVLSSRLEELTQLNLSPEEGFVLSRINGSYDIRSLVKISPMNQLDALLVFHKLLKNRHIKLE